MLAILTSAVGPHETVELAFRRKERELLTLCDSLAPVESKQLARRLERAKPGDELAAAFSRLIYERRQRIVHFLDDARRRAALKGVK